jgi:hypothetical protein
VERLFYEMVKKEDRKLIVEIPLDVITSLNKSLATSGQLSNYYRFKMWNISFGSLVNLAKYFVHFSVRPNAATHGQAMASAAASKPSPLNHMLVEIKIVKKCLIVYFYLNSRKRM